jgi:predicted TIM-barrel fold metal-dependent hydrolase
MKAVTIKLVLRYAILIFLGTSCVKKTQYYSASDYVKVPKIDVHFHYLTCDLQYMEFASHENFRLLSPNWDWENTIDEQLRISDTVRKCFPDQFAFFGTFSADSFGSPDFVRLTISRINECISRGSTGIKIWKNIGMTLKDENGRFVMVDDPGFDPIFNYMEERGIPVMGHLGEPRDCWLPEDEMTDPSDVVYYRNHPEYYMYKHPEVPDYETQIRARDNLLKKHPHLDFIGAHLASLEWNVDSLAVRLDSFPNLKVDLSARMYHLRYQAEKNRDKVRDFMIKYQDRILYGTDNEVHTKQGTDPEKIKANLHRGWMSQWIFLATDSLTDVKGLQLPREVIDKIYCKNAERYFKAISFKKDL